VRTVCLTVLVALTAACGTESNREDGGSQDSIDVSSSSALTLPATSVYSNDVLAGWPAEAVLDSDPNTVYSSKWFGSSSNNRGTYIAAWLPGLTAVAQVVITARMSYGRALAFPQVYYVYLTAADNSRWELLGAFYNQPSSDGKVIINVGNSVTAGVLIQPSTLGKDDTNNYYFQLAGIAFQPTTPKGSEPPSPCHYGMAYYRNLTVADNWRGYVYVNNLCVYERQALPSGTYPGDWSPQFNSGWNTSTYAPTPGFGFFFKSGNPCDYYATNMRAYPYGSGKICLDKWRIPYGAKAFWDRNMVPAGKLRIGYTW
jgi:hypothetical protein